jgi:uncharacterized protein YoxC
MDFLTIQGLTGKLQAHKERFNDIQEDIGAQAFFSKKKKPIQEISKMVIDIPNEVEDVDKAEEEADLKEETKVASTGQSVNQIKQTSQLVHLTV